MQKIAASLILAIVFLCFADSSVLAGDMPTMGVAGDMPTMGLTDKVNNQLPANDNPIVAAVVTYLKSLLG